MGVSTGDVGDVVHSRRSERPPLLGDKTVCTLTTITSFHQPAAGEGGERADTFVFVADLGILGRGTSPRQAHSNSSSFSARALARTKRSAGGASSMPLSSRGILSTRTPRDAQAV